jgi:hypothetical protein
MLRSLVHIIQSASGPVNIPYMQRIFNFLTVIIQLINLEGLRNLESVNHQRCYFIPVRYKKRGLALCLCHVVYQSQQHTGLFVVVSVCHLLCLHLINPFPISV